MTSLIDITKPVFGNPTTQSVRDNFSIASTEITDLQSRTVGGPWLSLTGGTLTGRLQLSGDPANAVDAATKNYVDNTVAAQTLYRGTYQVAADTPPLSTSVALDGYAWVAVTADPVVAEALTVSLPPLTIGTMIYNGDSLHFTTASGWQVVQSSAMTPTQADLRYVQLTGATMTGPLVLAGDPTLPDQAATKQYIDDVVTGAAGGAGLAPLNSPAFTGTPTAPTALPGTSTTQLATTAFVLANVGTGGGGGGVVFPITVAQGGTNATSLPIPAGPTATTLGLTNALLTTTGTTVVPMSGNSWVGNFYDASVNCVGGIGSGQGTPYFGMAAAHDSLVSPTALQANDCLGRIIWYGWQGGTWSSGTATLGAFASQQWSPSAGGTNIVVATAPNNSVTPRTVATFGQDGTLTLPVAPLGVASGGTGATNLAVPALPALPAGWAFTGTFLLGRGTNPVTTANINTTGTVGNWGDASVVCLGAGQQGYIELARVNGTLSSPTPLTSGINVGGVFFDGYAVGGMSGGSRAWFNCATTENWTATGQGTQLNWATTARGTVTTGVTMSLDGSGNLNITGGLSATQVVIPNNHWYYGVDTSGTAHPLLSLSSDNNVYLNYDGVGLTLVRSSMRLSGAYLYINNGGGSVNTTGGPFIYADGTNWAIKAPSGNGAVLVQNYAGNNAVTLGYNGNIWASNNITTDSVTTNAGYFASGSQVTIGYNGITYFGSNAIAFTWGGGCQVWIDRSRQGHIAIVDDSNNLSLNGFYGNYIRSYGNIDANYLHSYGDIRADNTLHCGNQVDVNGIQLYNGGGVIRCDSAVRFAGVLPTADNAQSCGLGGGNAWAQVAAYWFNTVSARDMKTDIERPPEGALDQLRRLNPAKFRFKEGPYSSIIQRGFIADEVRDALGEDFGGYRKVGDQETITYSALTAVLWQAVQELAAKVEQLSADRPA
jgi:hypothetical protein